MFYMAQKMQNTFSRLILHLSITLFISIFVNIAMVTGYSYSWSPIAIYKLWWDINGCIFSYDWYYYELTFHKSLIAN